MLDSFTAFTHEVDDADAAVAEILEQLDLGGRNKLRKNTVGIISCFADFAGSGVFSALCEKLPFDVVGTTTIENITAGEIGETMLVLMVLTSDELVFSTALSESVPEESEAPLRALYEAAAANLPGKPALMLSFVPLLTSVGSDFYVDCMTEISGNVPNFGTLAVDHNVDYSASRVLYNGAGYPDRFALLLIHGPIEPVFFVGSISDDKVFPEKGIVTASAGNQLQTVDGMPVTEYLKSLGLTQNEDGSITGINSFPVIMDLNDGTTPVARAMFGLTPEGFAVCGGNFPVGATLSIGSFNPDEILATTERTLEKAVGMGNRKTLLIYSCVGRYFTQGYDPTAEFMKVAGRLDSSFTYMAAYSGGELCPVYNKEGGMVNRNHNNTFIICAF